MKGEAMRILLGLALLVLPATVAWGDGGDSSADAGANFHDVVATSQAAMIRVPVNAAGDEDTSSAEIRVYAGPAVNGQPADFRAAWDRAADGNTQPVVNGGDSSTNGGYGYYGWYNPYRSYGWYGNYYTSYYPSYYYSGYYYNYGSPYYYDYSNSWYYGNGYNYYYRYYWYPRNW
jgi:hypothetical protein